MKTRTTATIAAALGALLAAPLAFAGVSDAVLSSIGTPNQVETSIGTLEFLDGAPSLETAQKVYDYLDTMRGVDAFLKGMPGASLQALIKGGHSLGAVQASQVVIMDKLLDSSPLFLTGNTSTLYVVPALDLLRDGPTVVEAPAGMLGAFNDAWFRYMQDIYPDTDSAWMMAWVDKNVFFNGKDGKTMNSDARVMFHYPFTAVTPAMAVSRAGVGSDYGIAYVDANKQSLDGSRTYKLHIPADAPAKDFWAVTMYDNQTRSQLQTSQPFPTVGSQSKGLKQNDDGSYDIYFAPKAPKGFENNWLATSPGKGWFTILRIYGPLQAWIDKTWRPGEIEPAD